jgi:CPA2 family monovalent cation:H+ antiporter-2
MEATALPILELGALFLAAAAFGYGARRLGLPAVIGYLVVGLVAFQLLPESAKPDRDQVQLLADVGVVLLLFEVGIELDVGRLRREHRSLLVAAPLQILTTTIVAGLVLVALGLAPDVGLILGLCVAMSSSVVIVNITRSRARRTNKHTETALLGWSLLQDLTGVVVAALLLAVWGAEARPPADAILALGLFFVLAVVAAQLFPIVLARLAGLSGPLPAGLDCRGPPGRRHRGRHLRHPAGPGGLRGWLGRGRGSHQRRGAASAASLP